jgi:hypothetical protein
MRLANGNSFYLILPPTAPARMLLQPERFGIRLVVKGLIVILDCAVARSIA